VPSSAADDIEKSARQHRLQRPSGSRTDHHDRKLQLRLRAIGVDKAAGPRPRANTTAERPSEFVTIEFSPEAAALFHHLTYTTVMRKFWVYGRTIRQQ
jgi:hypothetical protein